MADYRIINLATGRETYLHDVPEQVAYLAYEEHRKATGEPHYVQELSEREAPPELPGISWDPSDWWSIARDPAPEPAVELSLDERVDRSVRAYVDWLNGLPDDEGATVLSVIGKAFVEEWLEEQLDSL